MACALEVLPDQSAETQAAGSVGFDALAKLRHLGRIRLERRAGGNADGDHHWSPSNS
jgi:hypothetical protein